MTYSTALRRHIDAPIDRLNHFDQAELDSALAAVPGYPDIGPSDIRAAADRGDINARLVLERAAEGDPVAQDWV